VLAQNAEALTKKRKAAEMSMSAAEVAAAKAKHSALVASVETRLGPAPVGSRKASIQWEKRKTDIKEALGTTKQALNSWLTGRLLLDKEAQLDTQVAAWLGAEEAEDLDDVAGSGGGGGSAEIDEDGWEVAADGFEVDSSSDIPDDDPSAGPPEVPPDNGLSPMPAGCSSEHLFGYGDLAVSAAVVPRVIDEDDGYYGADRDDREMDGVYLLRLDSSGVSQPSEEQVAPPPPPPPPPQRQQQILAAVAVAIAAEEAGSLDDAVIQEQDQQQEQQPPPQNPAAPEAEDAAITAAAKQAAKETEQERLAAEKAAHEQAVVQEQAAAQSAQAAQAAQAQVAQERVAGLTDAQPQPSEEQEQEQEQQPAEEQEQPPPQSRKRKRNSGKVEEEPAVVRTPKRSRPSGLSMPHWSTGPSG
jgi:hypothetical protein